jgi:putative restriction endonuclease
MKIVLDTKPESGYRDEPARRYHFPSKYKRVIDEAVGDWAVFRRTRASGGHMGYIGVGQIARVEPDPEMPNHHFAHIANFLDFDAVVPWRDGGHHHERITYLAASFSRTSATSVRPISKAWW